MPSLQKFADSPSIKLLLIGHSKSRKTSSLASLVRAGYRLIVADFDGNLDYLAHSLQKTNPDLVGNILYHTFKDRTRINKQNNIVPVGTPHAFEDFQQFLDEGVEPSIDWKRASKEERKAKNLTRYEPLINPDTGKPLGPVNVLGPNWILVIDSLWNMGRAAFLEHAKVQPTADPRKTYGGAGQMLLALMDNLKDEEFTTHAVVISHMTAIELASGVEKFFPSSIGKRNPQDIPKLFPRLLVAERRGQGKNAKYVISTISTDDIDAGSALPAGAVPDYMPQEEGLAMYFKACGVSPTEKNAQ